MCWTPCTTTGRVSPATLSNPFRRRTRSPFEQGTKTRHHVLVDGAAQAPCGKKEDVVVKRFEQEVVDSDLVELVDEHPGLGHPGVLEQRVQERRLAAPEESGDDRYWGLRIRDRVAHSVSFSHRNPQGRANSAAASGPENRARTNPWIMRRAQRNTTSLPAAASRSAY